MIQGSVVVLRNADAAILAEAGGRQVYKDRYTRYSDYNRVTDSLRQPGSAMEAARVPGRLPPGPGPRHHGARRADRGAAGRRSRREVDRQLRQPVQGPDPRCARRWPSPATRWPCGSPARSASDKVIQTARELGIRTPLQPYITTALGASEVRLLELAGVYRAMASGILAEPHVIARVTDASGGRALRGAPASGLARRISSAELSLIQEGLRGVVRLPSGTAHTLDGRDFPIPVMGKTGTTSDFRDALFVGSTYGPQGITVAVRIGFDDNRALGEKETGGARGAADLPRDHAPRLQGQAGGAGAAVPPRDRGRDRRVPGAAGLARGARAGQRRRPRGRPAGRAPKDGARRHFEGLHR